MSEDEFDFSGDFVSEENVVNNDILTITGNPTIEEKESPNQKVVVNGVIRPKKYMIMLSTREVNF